jgi:hypothetical protein
MDLKKHTYGCYEKGLIEIPIFQSEDGEPQAKKGF